MKKTLAILLAVVMVFLLAACDAGRESAVKTEPATEKPAATEQTTVSEGS